MLSGAAAAPDIVIALPVMRFGKNHGAATGGTAHKAADPVLVAAQRAAMIGTDRLLLVKAGLSCLKFLCRHQWLVLAVSEDDIRIIKVPAAAPGGVPPQLADIHGIAEDILHGAVFKGAAAVSFDAHIVEPAGDVVSALPGIEAAEHFPHIDGLVRDGNKDIVFDGIAESGGGLQLTPAVLLLHAALDVLGQIDGVILIHGLDHGFHDDTHLAVLDGLLDGDHIDLQLLAQNGLIVHGIVTVAGEAGELPQKDSVKGLGLRLGGGDQAAEVITACDLPAGLGLVHKNIFVGDEVPVGGGPLAYLHQLGGGGELHLIVGGDADIGGSGFVVEHETPP